MTVMIMSDFKLFYTVGEVAAEIGESVTLVRFWANKFEDLVKPVRNRKGNRMFTPQGLDVMRKIHFLVKEKGMTLDGAYRRLAAEDTKVGNNVRILESLRNIRAQLAEISDMLK